jgi:hypothetical protein
MARQHLASNLGNFSGPLRGDPLLVVVSVAMASLALVACGDDTATSSGSGGGSSGTGSTTSATGSTGDTTGTGSGGDTGTGSGGAPAGSYTVTWGPYEVPAGTDDTKCVTKRLGNPGELRVSSIHNQLGAVSHHLIVYKVSDTEEQPEPYDCDPFQDTLDPTKGMPLMITQKADETLTLPEGVAFTLEPDQMIRLEMHYVNPGTEAATMQATSTMIPIAEGAFRDEAGFLFAGNFDVDVPANAETTLGPSHIDMPEELEGKKFFAFTGHVHKFGTNVTVEMSNEDTSVSAYGVEDFSWSEPPTQYHDPELVLPVGGGFDLTCTWNNTSNEAASLGEEADDEMCFFWAYYYPSVGSRVCLRSDELNQDLCCPGPSLCTQIL